MNGRARRAMKGGRENGISAVVVVAVIVVVVKKSVGMMAMERRRRSDLKEYRVAITAMMEI